MKITKSNFGKTSNGDPVDRFSCTNDNGLSMSLITYGAIMQSMLTPDKNGQFENINLGCDSVEGYEKCVAYVGATVGRFCNRIAHAKFSIDGTEYPLAVNCGPHSLHGGVKGFSHAVWRAEEVQMKNIVGVRFTHTSPDGDEGFPGTMNVTADYLLNNDNELTIEFRATTDAKTVVNLTNHNYWNLGGVDSGKILDHVLQVEADESLAVDDTLIPSGKFAGVADTELDFRSPRAIGDRIASMQETPAKGYDHCYVVRQFNSEKEPNQLRSAASVYDPKSGRSMSIETTQPGIQLYTGNWLSGDEGTNGYNENEAFCLETQHFPDSPNFPNFPTTELNPGEEFNATTIHRFGLV